MNFFHLLDTETTLSSVRVHLQSNHKGAFFQACMAASKPHNPIIRRYIESILFSAAKPHELVHSYILDEYFPIADDCQNWSLLNSHTGGGFLIFEATHHGAIPKTAPL
jgi:hypothetical protein